MTTVSNELKIQVEAEIERCRLVAEAHYGRSFDFPTITYKKRGTTAGTANDRTYTINLNAVLLNENGEKFIDGRIGRGTVTHEFAHLVDGIVNPGTRETGLRQDRYGNIRRGKRSVHGPQWKAVMRLLGVRNPTRCHSYDTTNSRVKKTSSKKHVWVCGCGNGKVTLTDMKHARQKANAPQGYGAYSRGHTPKRCGVYTYKGIDRPVQTAVAPKAPVKTPAGGTKLDVALQIVRENWHTDRAFTITKIINACNMSHAGAQTYYYKARKIAEG